MPRKHFSCDESYLPVVDFKLFLYVNTLSLHYICFQCFVLRLYQTMDQCVLRK